MELSVVPFTTWSFPCSHLQMVSRPMPSKLSVHTLGSSSHITRDKYNRGTRCRIAAGYVEKTHPVQLRGKKKNLEKLWGDFFSDPSQWWDNRTEKVNPRYPDFKHKETQYGLWLIDKDNPPWVESGFAAMTPGIVQVDLFTWNTRLARCVKTRQYEKTMELFHLMLDEGMVPNTYSFVPVLSACASLGSLEKGRCIHEQIIESGLESNVYVGSCLIDMYAKCGSIEDAFEVFSKMPRRNMFSWSAMILGYVKCGDGQKALELSREMQDGGLDADPVTFVAVLNACASVAALQEGRRVHEQLIERGYQSNIFVQNSLVAMYAKCGSIEEAQKLFENMTKRDVVTWTAMLAGYAMHGQAKEALEHFEWMCQESVEINEVTFISLLAACSHAGLVDEGLHYFESMSAVYSITATVEHYACVVDLLGRAGHLHAAEDLIQTMTWEANASMWRSLLGACRVHGNLDIAERAGNQVLELDPQSSLGYVLLTNIYAAAGRWDSSERVQQQKLERGTEKQPQRTWIEVNGAVYSFILDDRNHRQIVEIHKELETLSVVMEEVGFVPETSLDSC